MIIGNIYDRAVIAFRNIFARRHLIVLIVFEYPETVLLRI